ncbi:hypothetical protein [Acinetobacter sp. ANC 3882]|uniref:hypothetical protein n=1 Tax=Acinetobacter sp. ANC 3882 TaxID=2923423 RepID=UPI001F4B7F2A|nr:hypothetical protein [Acinetobacter sp. ANC 3882]MCH7313352.1 hypothetical protein [Acinetobacter sp. ANC 3882]
MLFLSISHAGNINSFRENYVNLSDAYFKSLDDQIQFEYGLKGKEKSNIEQLEAKQKECLVEKSKMNLHQLIIDRYSAYQRYMQDIDESIQTKNEFKLNQNVAQEHYLALKNELKKTQFSC